MLYILLRYDKIKNFSVIFFGIGSIANFIDFLTHPLITLTLPLTIFCILRQKEANYSVKKNIIEIVKISLSWGIGYGLTWITKWMLVDIILQRNIINVAINQALFRSVKYNLNYFDTVMRNINIINKKIFSFLIIISSLILLYRSFKENYTKTTGSNCIPFIMIIMIPLAWYYILRNHSYLHAFFTYRNLIVLVMNLPIIILSLLSKEADEKDKIVGE